MKKLGFIILSTVLIYSCIDEEQQISTIEENQNSASFLPLQTGNYWIYETFKIDTLGNEELIGDTHMISIVKDTTINGEIYYLEEDENYGLNAQSTFKKDSSGYVLDRESNILFSSTNFTDVLLRIESGPSIREYSMNKESQIINVPAGEFDCLNFSGMVTHIDPNEEYPARTLNNFYSEGIGLISSTIFYFSNTGFYYERRLKEYYVQ